MTSGGKMYRPRGLSYILIIMALLAGVLMGVGGDSLKAIFFSKQLELPIKRIEHYWQKTNLNENSLLELVNNDLCQSTEIYFLSCVNSLRKALNLRTNQTEKTALENLKLLYGEQKIDFESLWLTLLKNENSQDKKAALVASGINGFLSVSKDPHTYIMPANYQNAINSSTERSKLFVGVTLEAKENGKIYIRKVFKTSDAEKAGLKSGDQLLAFNNIESKDLDLEKISESLRDEKQIQFSFKIQRDAKAIKLNIKRSFIPVKYVQTEVFEGFKNYGIMTVSKFTQGVCFEVKSQLQQIIKQKVSGIVLDLRDNPGGYLEEASCMAGLFLDKDQLVYSVQYINSVRPDEVSLSSSSLAYSGPLTVLVNSSSASAAELLAGALQEYGRAVVVGERTFGKGTFQEAEAWIKNPEINIYKTKGFYLLPSGKSPQLKGIAPDIVFVENQTRRREEDMYYRPLQAENIKAQNRIKKVSLGFLKNNCIYDNTLVNDDKLLEQGLQTVACQSKVSTLALGQKAE